MRRDRIAVLGARSAPKRHWETSQGLWRDIKGRALGWLCKQEADVATDSSLVPDATPIVVLTADNEDRHPDVAVAATLRCPRSIDSIVRV